MRFGDPLVVAAFLFAQVQGQFDHPLWERVDATIAPPACSLPCLATIVPELCGSLTNLTCICSPQLTAALSPCVSGACDITDSLLVERYSAITCGVKNDKTRQQEQFNVYYVVPALATLFVGARVYVRIKLDVGLGPDDWMMVAALCGYLTDVATGLSITIQGFGQHTYWLPPNKVTRALMFFYISEIFYIVAITLTKLSLLLFFRRIFPNQNFRIGVWVMFGFVIVSNFALLMALCLQCIPFEGNWTNWMYKVPPVKCIDTFAAVYVAAALSIIHDVVILVMPIPLLWKLNLAWQKKANLSIMFSVGSFVILCSLLRLPSLRKLKASTDPSYDQAPIAVWTDLEIGVGVICGCLPAFRSLIGYLVPSMKMSLVADNSGNALPYAGRSRSVGKQDHKRIDSSMRTFVELDDLHGSEDDLHQKTVETGSITTHTSEAPITDTLVPSGGKGFGNRVRVNVGDLEVQSAHDSANSIVMTKTVRQSRHRF